MGNINRHKLSLDRPAKYQIKVQGRFEGEWIGFTQKLLITTDNDQGEILLTILTGVFDQSALQGVLRYLYSIGIPLISVLYIGDGGIDIDLNG